MLLDDIDGVHSIPFDLLHDNMPMTCFTLTSDGDGNIINVNRFGAQFLGYSADEIVKCPVLDLYVADDRGLAQEKLANAVDMLGAVQRWDIRHIKKNGVLHPLLTSIQVVHPGQIGRFIDVEQHPGVVRFNPLNLGCTEPENRTRTLIATEFQQIGTISSGEKHGMAGALTVIRHDDGVGFIEATDHPLYRRRLDVRHIAERDHPGPRLHTAPYAATQTMPHTAVRVSTFDDIESGLRKALAGGVVAGARDDDQRIDGIGNALGCLQAHAFVARQARQQFVAAEPAGAAPGE